MYKITYQLTIEIAGSPPEFPTDDDATIFEIMRQSNLLDALMTWIETGRVSSIPYRKTLSVKLGGTTVHTSHFDKE